MRRVFVGLLTFCLILNPCAPVYFFNSFQNEKLAPPTQLKSLAGETAKTFVASLTAGKKVTEVERLALDQEVKGVIQKAFKAKGALRLGKMTPQLSAQIPGDPNLAARAAQAYRILAEAALAYVKKESQSAAAKVIRTAGWHNVRVDADGGRALPRVVFLTGNNRHPALMSKGNAHLIGSSGHYRLEEALRESPYGSHYVTLTLVESAIPVLGVEKGMAFLGAWIAHETQVLKERRYVEPGEKEEKVLNKGYRQILKEREVKRSAYARLNAEDRKWIDGIVPHSGVAREVLARLFLNEMPEPAAKLDLLELGFDAPTLQRWCSIVLGKTPLSRATLQARDPAAEKLLAVSL